MTKARNTTKHQNPSNEPDLIWPELPKSFWKLDFGKLSLGLFLVIIGLLYLAYNFGWLPISIHFQLWDLWPMLLIFLGLSLISGRGWIPVLAGSILTMTVLLISAILITDRISLDNQLNPDQFNYRNSCQKYME